MKKHILEIIGLTMLFVVGACGDATDIVQEDELNEQAALRNLQDAQSFLNGVYAAYDPDGGGNGTGDAIYHNAIFTDNLKSGIANNGQGAQAYRHIVDISGNSATEFIWPDRYGTIFNANVALNAIDNFTFNLGDLAEVDHIKGQLYALRALAHFDLFQYYTVDYQDDAALSVINIDFVPTISDQLERNTVAETIAFIKSDLDAAQNLIDPSNSTTSGDPAWISRDFVKGLKVKLALLEGNYGSDILTMADELLNDYPLAAQGQYFNMFSDADNTEVIFKLARLLGDNGVGDLFYFNQIIPTDAYLEMSNELYNELAELPNDIRFFVNLDAQSNFIGTNDPNNLLLIRKYPGGSGGLQVNDIKVMRSSEIQLIKAELQARNGDLTGAATTIRELRNIRTATTQALPVYGSLNEALLDILKERRKELCYEGHRFLDLKRIGGELNLGVDRLSVDCESFGADCNLAANNFRFTLGIPQSELDGNRVISQNPGY